MNNQDSKFLALQKKWYKKIADDGFVDVEQGEVYMTSYSNRLVDYDPVVLEARQKYYELAGQMLHEHKFKSKKEKAIWAYHAEGMAIRTIVTELHRRNFKTYKRQVHETIQNLKQEMVKKVTDGQE